MFMYVVQMFPYVNTVKLKITINLGKWHVFIRFFHWFIKHVCIVSFVYNQINIKLFLLYFFFFYSLINTIDEIYTEHKKNPPDTRISIKWKLYCASHTEPPSNKRKLRFSIKIKYSSLRNNVAFCVIREYRRVVWGILYLPTWSCKFECAVYKVCLMRIILMLVNFFFFI